MHEKALQLLTDEVIHFVASSDRNWTLDDPAEISKDFVWNVLFTQIWYWDTTSSNKVNFHVIFRNRLRTPTDS